jgi:hypothetical protein
MKKLRIELSVIEGRDVARLFRGREVVAWADVLRLDGRVDCSRLLRDLRGRRREHAEREAEMLWHEAQQREAEECDQAEHAARDAELPFGAARDRAKEVAFLAAHYFAPGTPAHEAGLAAFEERAAAVAALEARATEMTTADLLRARDEAERAVVTAPYGDPVGEYRDAVIVYCNEMRRRYAA